VATRVYLGRRLKLKLKLKSKLVGRSVGGLVGQLLLILLLLILPVTASSSTGVLLPSNIILVLYRPPIYCYFSKCPVAVVVY
jgi:hypothetical protein